MTPPNLYIRPATGLVDMGEVRRLFTAYHDELDEDLCFQGVEEEFATLPGPYAEPKGIILLGFMDEDTVPKGVVAFKPLSDSVCEMKRLYVCPSVRGTRLGSLLVDRLLDEAVKKGYQQMMLDTLPKLERAIAMYRSRGFVPTAPYNEAPLKGILYFSKTLKK